jgi:hypothetical protein
MNWKQLYTAAAPEERLEITILMLQSIKARQSKRILVGTQLIHDRRGPFAGAHFIRDRRQRSTRRTLYRWTYIFTLLTVSIGTWLFTFSAPANIGAPVMAAHLASLAGLLLFKPYRLKPHLSTP